jgi:hypothetical protein
MAYATRPANFQTLLPLTLDFHFVLPYNNVCQGLKLRLKTSRKGSGGISIRLI